MTYAPMRCPQGVTLLMLFFSKIVTFFQNLFIYFFNPLNSTVNTYVFTPTTLRPIELLFSFLSDPLQQQSLSLTSAVLLNGFFHFIMVYSVGSS